MPTIAAKGITTTIICIATIATIAIATTAICIAHD
jgi:hypothetical protein